VNWRREADRIAAEARGRSGEAQAEAWLTAQGWQIVDRRVKTPRGEIDIIARDGGCIVFVEVKWRARSADLADAIDERRLARVAAAAGIVFPRLSQGNDDMRIDVILLAPGEAPRHIANAWMPFQE